VAAGQATALNLPRVKPAAEAAEVMVVVEVVQRCTTADEPFSTPRLPRC